MDIPEISYSVPTELLGYRAYFNQVVASNLVNALMSARVAYPDKTEEETSMMVVDLWLTTFKAIEDNTKSFPQRK